MIRKILVSMMLVGAVCCWGCAGTRFLVNGIDLTPGNGNGYRGSVYIDGDTIPLPGDEPGKPTAVVEAGRSRRLGWGL